ncbi:MAG: hypothetical protein RBR45_11635 [Pseudomonas sp.]|nr:hypothetical protein [Pseudomonas sp.]
MNLEKLITASGATIEDFVMLLELSIDDVAEEWGANVSAVPMNDYLLRINSSHIVTHGGEIWTAVFTTEKAGIIWTGDEYLQGHSTKVELIEKIDEVEINRSISPEIVENLAAFIVDTVS